MSVKKRKKKTSKKRGGLGGIEAIMPATKVSQGGVIGRDQLGIAMLAVAGGNLVGKVVFDKHVLIPALIAGGIGLASRNIYCALAGAGILLAGAIPSSPETQGTSGMDDDGIEGFDLASLGNKMKERAKSYFSNFAEKLYLSEGTSTSAVQGLNGEGDNVNYFLNPYSQKQGSIDMSDLDRLQAQVQSMNQVSGPDEDMSDRIF